MHKILLSTISFWVVLGIGFSTSFASTPCEVLVGSVPQLGRTKEAFAAGRYNEFFEFTDHIAKSPTGSTTDQSIDLLRNTFPVGFSLYSTIMSKKISERFVSEIVVMQDDQGQAVFLGWDAINTNGAWSIANYYVSGDFTEIRETWGN
ncbi:hypothetical protein [Halocynthiibacter namhaensis]|uniref:hypothetical protein n=1 Tax=Halocynthiibacter namhaensis TaxID=1290553 RepID=UPI0005797ED1|nr:hypothetical protein [Halocynthiibacter namhaensis]